MALETPILWTDIDNKFNPDVKGGLRNVSNKDAVIQAIENIVLTVVGERVMRPTHGSKLTYQLFKSIGENSALKLGNYLKTALKNDDRFQVNEIVVIPDHDKGVYELTVTGWIPALSQEFRFDKILTWTL